MISEFLKWIQKVENIMKRIQLYEVTSDDHCAGSKAVQDVHHIAEQYGYETVNIKIVGGGQGIFGKVKRQVIYFYQWMKCLMKMKNSNIVLLQHPFRYTQCGRERVLRFLKTKKKIKFISLVHDVEELRTASRINYYQREFIFMLKLTDVLIVHNDNMKEYFINKGVSPDKIVILRIFDYIQTNTTKMMPVFEKSITIAGNLDTTKSRYIEQLKLLDGIKVNLFGPNFDYKMLTNKDIRYHGSFQADEIPMMLNSGFGLVWDGERIDTCQGGYGQYLRYNNPHKLSFGQKQQKQIL